MAINSLNNWKAPGADGIPAELLKYGDEVLHKNTHELCLAIWKEERLPEEGNKSIIIPLHKKGDKSECNNYIGIALQNTVYKLFARILLKRLQPIAEDCIEDYQCGFRKSKSTIDQLSVIGRITEKKFEFRQNIWQVFVDFKKG